MGRAYPCSRAVNCPAPARALTLRDCVMAAGPNMGETMRRSMTLISASSLITVVTMSAYAEEGYQTQCKSLLMEKGYFFKGFRIQFTIEGSGETYIMGAPQVTTGHYTSYTASGTPIDGVARVRTACLSDTKGQFLAGTISVKMTNGDPGSSDRCYAPTSVSPDGECQLPPGTTFGVPR